MSVISNILGDNEWFVYSEGYGTLWVPKSVIQGRLPALSRLCDNARITPTEKAALNSFLESAMPHPTGHSVGIVGQLGARTGQRTPDRRLTRVEMA